METRAIGSGGLEGLLLRGVIAGLLRYPSEIQTHGEALSSIRVADSELAVLLQNLLDATIQQEVVESEALLTILGTGALYNMAKGLLRADALNFTFTRRVADPDRARRDLGEAIRVMVAGPEIDAALAEATRKNG